MPVRRLSIRHLSIRHLVAIFVTSLYPVLSSAYIGGSQIDSQAEPTVQLYDLHKNTYCSGALIGSDFILTAAHCVFPKISSPGNFYITRGAAWVEATVESVYLHPDMIKLISQKKLQGLEEAAGRCQAPDVAIIKFSREDPWPFPVANIESRPLQPGSGVMVSGYGQQSADQTDLQDNSLKGAPDVFKGYRGTCLYTYDIAGRAAPGDSGAPIFLIYSNGTLGTVGVSSWGRPGIFGIDRADAFARLDDDSPTTIKMSKWISSVKNAVTDPFYSLR